MLDNITGRSSSNQNSWLLSCPQELCDTKSYGAYMYSTDFHSHTVMLHFYDGKLGQMSVLDGMHAHKSYVCVNCVNELYCS